MPPVNYFMQFLTGSSGMALSFQAPLRGLIAEMSLVRRTLLPVLRDAAITPSSAFAPRLNDFPRLSVLRQVLADIEGLPFPEPGRYDCVVVKPVDYASQSSLRRLRNGLTEPISLEEAINMSLRSVTKISTGSNNTLSDAIAKANICRNNLGLEEVVHQYLAMDLSWWPSPDASIIGLVSKNILVEAAISPIQSLVNEAFRINRGLSPSIDISHSYAQEPRAIGLNVFDPPFVIESKSIFCAPLGRPEAMFALVMAKNRFAGKITIARPGFDPLEEAATAVGEIFQNGIFDLLPTDLRLPTSGHSLEFITRDIRDILDRDSISLSELVDSHYSTRPGSVTYSTSFDGQPERNIRFRTGDSFTNDLWLKEYNERSLAQQETITSQISEYQKQIAELITICGPTASLEKAAGELKKIYDSLEASDSFIPVENLQSAAYRLNGVNTDLQGIIVSASHQMTIEQQERIKSLSDSINEIREIEERKSAELEDLINGEFEPEEA